jgi:hypothetical protein
MLQLSLAAETARAQAGFLGGIFGKAADETGGVLPGVTVTATSPALQVPRVTTVTDGEGNYRLRDLPAPGMYRVVFELPGFRTMAFDGVSLTAGFTAELTRHECQHRFRDVEVSGQSPIVDTVSVAGVSSITLERSNPSRWDRASRICSRWLRASAWRASLTSATASWPTGNALSRMAFR